MATSLGTRIDVGLLSQKVIWVSPFNHIGRFERDFFELTGRISEDSLEDVTITLHLEVIGDFFKMSVQMRCLDEYNQTLLATCSLELLRATTFTIVNADPNHKDNRYVWERAGIVNVGSRTMAMFYELLFGFYKIRLYDLK